MLGVGPRSAAAYDTTRDVDVHERDFIPKAKYCSVQWCKGVDKRRLASVLYDGSKDHSETTPPITRASLEKAHSGVRVKIEGYKWGSSELEYVNDSITELKPTTTNYVKCVKKNVAVGYAVNLLPPFLQTFISSFERYHGPCEEAILFVDDMRLAVQLDRTKSNVKFLDRSKWATRIQGAHRLSTSTQRVPVLEAWLKERWHRYHYVVHIDTRDVVFYGNMFTPLYRNNVTGLFSAGEALPFFTSTMNKQWVNKYSGIRVMSDYISTLHLHGRALPVICSGLYGGTSLALYDYFGGFAAAVAAANRAARETLGIDQGIHVYLQIFGLPLANFPHPIVLLDEGTGPMRHWYTRESSMLRDSLGRHVNCEMEPYAVVHQLDRYAWAWDDAFSDYKLKKDSSHGVDCRGAGVNESDTFAPTIDPVVAVQEGMIVPPVPAFLSAAVNRQTVFTIPAGVTGNGNADAFGIAGVHVTRAAQQEAPTAGGPKFEAVASPPESTPEERVWDPLHADDASHRQSRLTSQLYTTVCTAHNAVLLFAHVWDPKVLQPLIAAIQRYHTTCDTIVVFVPKQEAYEALAHGDATGVIFEGYVSPAATPASHRSGGAGGAAADGASRRGVASPATQPSEMDEATAPPSEPEVAPATAAPREGAPPPRRRPAPPTDEEARITLRRRAAERVRQLTARGRRLALAVISRWLLRHGEAFHYVTVVEDAARARVGVFGNLFAPLYKHRFEGLWLLPFLPSMRTFTELERRRVVEELAALVANDTAASLCLDRAASHGGGEPPQPLSAAVAASVHNVSALSSVYGGAMRAVSDFLQATILGAEAMDADAAKRAPPGVSVPQCSADPHVLEVFRSHVLPAYLMRRGASGFDHDVVVLDDLQGPFRHVDGLTAPIPDWSDRFGRLVRCDRARTPYALITGFATDGAGEYFYEHFRSHYWRRGESVRRTGYEAYFETHATGKVCH